MIKDFKVKYKKNLLNFVVVTILSFLFFEIIEYFIFEVFGFDVQNIEIGWLAFILIYGFKFHILCCLLPMLWITYKCRHKNCKHDHCEK